MSMSRKHRQRISRQLSKCLRHETPAPAFPMDAAGWVPVAAVLARFELSREDLEQIVAENNKQRLQLTAHRIRCCQGHSLDTMPVTQAALEASWVPWTAEHTIWHGTRVERLADIARDGLSRQRRTHVHLAPARDSHIGKRSNTPAVLEICSRRLRQSGHPIFESPNGVLLARAVPAHCILRVHAASPDLEDEVNTWNNDFRDPHDGPSL